MLAINQADIAKILDWGEAVQTIEAAFAALSTGHANVPLRVGLPVPAYDGLLLTMPGLISSANGQPDEAGLAVKMVSVFGRNPARQLPLIQGLVVLFEPDTGRPLALFDGGTLTAIRTGAAGGVATKHLAHADASIVALFGAGVQGETQLLAVAAVRPIRQVRVWSRNQQKAELFCQKMQAALKIPVTRAASEGEALAHADIVITATTSFTPVFEDADIADGVHINGVGSYTHAMREVPGETVARATVVVDAKEGAMAEAGDILIPMSEGKFNASHIYAEIGELCAGLKRGRTGLSHDAITFFKSVGNAVQDVAMARYLYSKARAAGLGQTVAL